MNCSFYLIISHESNPVCRTNYRHLNKDESVTAALCVPKNCDFQGRKYRYSYSSYFWPLSSEVDKGGIGWPEFIASFAIPAGRDEAATPQTQCFLQGKSEVESNPGQDQPYPIRLANRPDRFRLVSRSNKKFFKINRQIYHSFPRVSGQIIFQ